MQVRINQKLTKNHKKTRKTEHESGKGIKSRYQEGFHKCGSLFELNLSDLVLEESSVGKFSPWINFAKLAEITLEF